MTTPTVDRKRFRAALALKDETLQSAAAAAECSAQHLHYVLIGERSSSKRLRDALKAFLGEVLWQWVTRETNEFAEAA